MTPDVEHPPRRDGHERADFLPREVGVRDLGQGPQVTAVPRRLAGRKVSRRPNGASLPEPRSTLHVITSTTRRGAEVFATELDERLRARGRASTVAALRQGDTPTLDVDVLPHPGRSPQALRDLRHKIAEAAVVVAHGGDTLLAVSLAGVGLRHPFVYRLIGDPRYWSAGRLTRRRVGLLLRRADAVVTLNEPSGAVLRFRYGVRPDRIHVIPNGVDPKRFSLVEPSERDAARAHLGLDDADLVVAFVGALSREKDPLAAVTAVMALPPAHIVVAGAGPLRASIPTDPRVHALGAVTDVRPVYAAADIVVIPSLTEGVPAVAVEAALRGIPVVATAVGSMADVVHPGVTGVLVEAGDAAALLAGVAAAIEAGGSLGGEDGRRWALERFGLDEVVARWDGLLSGLVGE